MDTRSWKNPAWRRLARAFRPRLSRAQVAGGVLLAVLGFAATVQVRALSVQDDYSSATRPQLIQILDGLNQRSQRLRDEINELEDAHANLLSGSDRSDTALEQAEKREESLGILAGTLPATGPGVTIIITDSQTAVPASLMLNAIQELRDAGAEAIELNDEVRVVASSYVVDGQGGIIIDDVLLTPPYTIEAIGDQLTLSEAMRIPGGVVDEVSQKQGQVTVTEQEVVAIESLHRPLTPQHAEPAEEDGDN